jgi:uncharacterized protein YbaP (TraB family)
MMKRIMMSIVLVVVLSTWATAESSVWKARKGNSVIYLGGTFHMLREADFPLPPEFEAAYKASDIMVFETDIDILQDPLTQRTLLKKAMYEDGSTIDKHLSAQAYAELSAYCEANGIPLKAFGRLRPSMLILTLTVMELMKSGVTQQGVDRFFYERANDDGKDVEFLETADEQIEYLVSMADGIENEFVIYSIKDMKSVRDRFEPCAQAWRRGDAEKLDALMITELRTRWAKIYRKLFTDRNSTWLSFIDAYQKTSRTEFVLVGVGHLVGPDGILQALRNKGYTIDKL